MFVPPPFMGQGRRSQTKGNSRRSRQELSDWRAIVLWTVTIAVGLVIAGIVAWLFSA